eukprot:scaffold87717_cov64-Phaeocystis_antarctica.AAC.8
MRASERLLSSGASAGSGSREVTERGSGRCLSALRWLARSRLSSIASDGRPRGSTTRAGWSTSQKTRGRSDDPGCAEKSRALAAAAASRLDSTQRMVSFAELPAHSFCMAGVKSALIGVKLRPSSTRRSSEGHRVCAAAC